MKSPRAKIDGKGKARKVKAFAVVDKSGDFLTHGFGTLCIYAKRCDAVAYAKN